MLTVCWAAKGGSGTTVAASAMALSQPGPTLLIDLAGDVPLVVGCREAEQPGVFDWLASDVGTDRLTRIEQPITDDLAVIPAGEERTARSDRWRALAEHLACEPRHVIVDAGTGEPPPALVGVADAALLVTRACYLSLTWASRQAARPSGVILIAEPGRAMGRNDVERSVGAPVVATVLLDPKIARAVDSGLAVSRLPKACTDQLRAAA